MYEYDQDGRLVRATTTREPEWDEEQQAWILALAEYRATLCPGGCGGYLDETTDPANEGRYVPAGKVRCHKCDGLQLSVEQHRGADRPSAVMHRVRYLGPGPTVAATG